MEHFDVIVVGTGVAGQTAAEELAAAGKRVAIVDQREFGGTCLLRGCEPKKVLYAAAEVVERARAQSGRGTSGDLTLDWPALIAFKRTFTDPMSARIERTFADAGIVRVHGSARFTSPTAIEADGAPMSADAYVLATGAVPIPLGIPGEEFVSDSETFMAAETLPARIVFIGGGFVSFEFAHIAAAAGAHVSILHRGPHVLKGFDQDLADALAQAYRASGIEVHTGAPVTEVRRAGEALEVVCGTGMVVSCDMVVHGAGRAPDLIGLGLEAAGVAYGPRGIEVGASMLSASNPRVYAVGDAAALGAPLTPVGVAQARVARANILEPGSATFEPPAIPSVVFSSPPLAIVGRTEDEARAAGLDIEVKVSDMAGWTSSLRTGTRVAAAKTIVERSTGRIIGVHLLGHGAEEVVNVFAAAMIGGVTADEMRSAIWAYPTDGSNIVYLL